ncbi:MAG TPA: hypothetical protein VHU19_11050 [Pyrinomonadaceae bacterium]|jgi:hypothetical protein|nr:hypothetical protein [Pyrinomonadaceae bacterium]
MRKKRLRRRWFGALAGLAGLTAGAVGAALLLRRRGDAQPEQSGRGSIYPQYNRPATDRWARPGMPVTFRAELMPGRSRSERSFRVAEVLPSGRVLLEGFTGEHTETEFEPIRQHSEKPLP